MTRCWSDPLRQFPAPGQAIRNHRVALPDDEILLDELASVRLRNNTPGICRLDHDSGQHHGQAIALGPGTHDLLDADTSAEQWIAWARRRAIECGAILEEAPEAAPARRDRRGPRYP